MKVILTGATGFIGGEILTQLLAAPKVTSIIVLSRRPIPTTSPKLKTLIMEDFTTYPPSIMNELEGAEACIWTVGVKNAPLATHRAVTLSYTAAATTAFSALPTPSTPFRFVFMSGFLAVRGNDSAVWFMGEQRRLKGEAETLVLEFDRRAEADGSGVVGGGAGVGVVEPFVLRPAGVLSRRWVVAPAQALGVGIGVRELAGAAVGLAVEGGRGGGAVLENGELVRLGREVLAGRK